MTENKPKISVIVPVFNTEKYLTKCLESILNQTLKEIEIIIVNDGSTDNSQEIINYFSKKDSRILSIEKQNGGLSDARNLGIEKAKGEFISFVDSDDFIDEKMLESLYNLAIKNHAEIAFCDLIKVDENGNEFKDLPQSPQLPDKIILENNFTIFGEMGCFACNKIFKKSLFDHHRFKVGIHFEDIELIPKLVLDSNIITKINQPFYKYFERQHSISKTHNKKGLDIFLAINEVSDYFKKSKYQTNLTELKRFQIFQGYYSFLAYVAFVKDKLTYKEMIDCLINFMDINHIIKLEVIQYKRFGKVYINSLSFRKQVFYFISFLNLKLLSRI